MSTPAALAVRKNAATERGIALTTSLAPVVAGLTTPLLNGSATFLTTVAYGGMLAFVSANYMNRLHPTVIDNLPAADILRAQREPLFISALTTGVALGVTWKGGWAGTDLLMAGILDQPTFRGLCSLAWWGAAGLVPFKLRRVLFTKQTRPTSTKRRGPSAKTRSPLTDAQKHARAWAEHISGPNGTHRNQELTVTGTSPALWRGTIEAPAGVAVTVTRESVSSVYRVDPSWIELTDGSHAGEKHITVNFTAPPEHDPTTLQGAWRKWVSRSGGLLAGTRLEGAKADPNTGGEVAMVIAGENMNRLPNVDRSELAGAMRTTPLLISYEPRNNPREAVIRKMTHNPLEEGADFPGTHVLQPNENGYIALGPGISGFPARIQVFDPKLGAQHVIVAGVTGSGKGGTLQLIALAHHVNKSAIIYADPKGSSNPSIEKMAAYTALGPDEAIKALRVWFHILMHRIDDSARLGMKNFQPSDDRPWVPLILDEASSLLGEKAEYRAEAVYIVKEGARLGRSMGMPVILANQLIQLSELGGKAAIRDNIFMGGSLVLLRSDSTQKSMLDLPDNFKGCNPADIPPAWSEERDLVYDPTVPLNDPTRTFGLAFAASPGAHPEMMRNWILEDATPYIDPANFTIPADWADWDNRDDLATRSVLPEDQEEDDDDDLPTGTGTPQATKKATAPADTRITTVLKDAAVGAGDEPNYMHKDDIARFTKLEPKTVENTLTKLKKAGKVHGGDRGYWAIGPAPTNDTQEQQ